MYVRQGARLATLNLQDLSLFMCRHVKGFDRSLCDANAARAKDAAGGGAASGALVPADQTAVVKAIVDMNKNMSDQMIVMNSNIVEGQKSQQLFVQGVSEKFNEVDAKMNNMDTKLNKQAKYTDAKLATMTKGVEKVAKGVNSEMKKLHKHADKMEKEMDFMKKRLAAVDAQQGSSSGTVKRKKLSKIEKFNRYDKNHEDAFTAHVENDRKYGRPSAAVPAKIIEVMRKYENIEMDKNDVVKAMGDYHKQYKMQNCYLPDFKRNKQCYPGFHLFENV